MDDDPYILLDITGRPRPAAGADAGVAVGCSQYYETDAGRVHRPWTAADVGPDFIMSYYPTMQVQYVPLLAPAWTPPRASRLRIQAHQPFTPV